MTVEGTDLAVTPRGIRDSPTPPQCHNLIHSGCQGGGSGSSKRRTPERRGLQPSPCKPTTNQTHLLPSTGVRGGGEFLLPTI